MKKIIAMFLLIGTFGFASAQSAYYNNYRSSVTDVNWETVAADLLLSPQQKNELFALNNQYSDYNSWNNHYGKNPDAWRTERYEKIEKIMGPEKYKKFRTKYYKGQDPREHYKYNVKKVKKYKKPEPRRH